MTGYGATTGQAFNFDSLREQFPCPLPFRRGAPELDAATKHLKTVEGALAHHIANLMGDSIFKNQFQLSPPQGAQLGNLIAAKAHDLVQPGGLFENTPTAYMSPDSIKRNAQGDALSLIREASKFSGVVMNRETYMAVHRSPESHEALDRKIFSK